MKMKMMIWFSFLCFIALVYSSPDDAAMNALRDSLVGHGWSGQDPCKWSGVQCDRASQRVTRIQLKNSNLTGTLPLDLKTLLSLTVFEVMNNSLSGEIPSFAGLTDLQTVNLHDNDFTSIASDFFTGLTSLQSVYLDNNPFGPWEIPLSLKDATSLVSFSATSCNLNGKIPEFVGGQTFPGLQLLKLSSNKLLGELPISFAGSPIQTLWLNGQSLNGSITVLQNMSSLTEVLLNSNQFSGPIPDLSGLVSLKRFIVRDNQLTGIVPSSLTELTSLSDVALGNNYLQGPTPSFKAKLSTLDKSGTNSFCLSTTGASCDPRVETLLSIVEAFGYPLRFAKSWQGNDPCSTNMWLGITCSSGDITTINFQKMELTGTISPRFANLTSLQNIYLSQNNLTGTIPQELVSLSNLKTLDVSDNHLYGKVPDFRLNNVNTSGNPDIGKDRPRDGPGSGKKASSNAGKFVGIVIGVVVLLLIGYVIFFVVKKKKLYRKMRFGSSEDQGALKITIANMYGGGRSEGGFSSVTSDHVMDSGYSTQALRDATDNFDEKNILGRGGFGIVYKGELHDGTKIAVKRMGSSVISGKGLDEFKSEIDVLTKVRHRNLVVLHGFCLEGDERLLVYEYMPQGTLSRHLFQWQEEGLKPLEWSRRLLIALDVARGVEYLHMLAHQSFIHRDLKPSNILLGDDMHAKVADFGLVRLAPEGTQSIETKIAGTFGYLAPEYAVTGRVTTKVDVYSFGVILMELLTGRKALDAKRSEEDVHLATWFRRMLINKDKFVNAIDETIGVNEEILGSVNKVAELASHCSAREPQQRPDMSHVVNVLASLVAQWKPEKRCGDIYGIDFDTHSTSSSLRQEQSFSMSSLGL